jgi:RNA polymerase sigma factor (sigma-70 family)
MGYQDGLTDFGAFYERTYGAAFRVAYGIVGERTLAEDVTQDAYVNAYRERRRFRGDGPPDAWLYRIVVNGAVSALRRRRVRFVQPLDPAVAGERTGGSDVASAAVRHVVLVDGLQGLDPRARSAVVLRYYLDLDYATIGSIIGASPDNVGAILSRSLDRLRGLIEPDASAPDVRVSTTREAGEHGTP